MIILEAQEAFDTARTECIKYGYLSEIVHKEDFIMNYKNFPDYDAQLKAEGKAEAAIEMMKKGLDSDLIADIVKMPVEWVEGLKISA